MAVLESVKRNIHLNGSCEEWFPVVLESLLAHNCKNIVADESTLHFDADYEHYPIHGQLSLTLSSSLSHNETNIDIISNASWGGTYSCY